MDEVAATFDISSTRTIGLKGKKEIILSNTGAEKLNFSVVLCCMANGDKYQIMVIFKRKTMPKDSFPKGINVVVAPRGWMNEKLCLNGSIKFGGREKIHFLSILGTQFLYMTLIGRI